MVIEMEEERRGDRIAFYVYCLNLWGETAIDSLRERLSKTVVSEYAIFGIFFCGTHFEWVIEKKGE